MPDYEIVEWNETAFDVNISTYVSEALEAKKWAFVSDYVRLWALFNYGGIYLDTDVEVFKSLEPFLINSAFTGFEKCYNGDTQPITAVMGAKRGHPWIRALLNDYNGRSFLTRSGLDLTTNTLRISRIMTEQYAVVNNDTYQVLADDLHLYPSDVFCYRGRNSYAMHHFSGSWKPPMARIRTAFGRTFPFLRKFRN
jgi:mannosyltransferase OCH1-like enzyme